MQSKFNQAAYICCEGMCCTMSVALHTVLSPMLSSISFSR